MGLYKRVLVWFAWCTVITASINLIFVARNRHPHQHRTTEHTPSPSESVQYQETTFPKVFLKGEVYCLRDSEYHSRKNINRPGLKEIHSMYQQLLATSAYYSHSSFLVRDLITTLKKDITKRWVTDDPWDLARKWASPSSLVPESAPGLGDILAAMNGAPIIATDIGFAGTQLKVMTLLKGGQRAVFKPQWYSRDEVIEGEIYAGADRHNGEIAAFHLGRLLGIGMVPLAVGRKVSLRKEILAKASRKLSATFHTRGRKTCFYGVCYYCNKKASICDDGHTLEGVMILWLPQRLQLSHWPHPWAHTYEKYKFALWEEYSDYCESIQSNPFFDQEKSPRFLDLMDTAVFDFLQQNGDRHHYTVISGEPKSNIVLLDNGKSFGDPYVDHLDVLAPLLQCCRLRQTTYERLVLLSGGGLSHAMGKLLQTDPISPVLARPHLLALDRRIHHILATLAACKEKAGSWHKVLF